MFVKSSVGYHKNLERIGRYLKMGDAVGGAGVFSVWIKGEDVAFLPGFFLKNSIVSHLKTLKKDHPIPVDLLIFWIPPQ